jgi:hypothetical protein
MAKDKATPVEVDDTFTLNAQQAAFVVSVLKQLQHPPANPDSVAVAQMVHSILQSLTPAPKG